jgi:hypothetical protein
MPGAWRVAERDLSRHCEERDDEAIHSSARLDCLAPLAKTIQTETGTPLRGN